MKSIKSAHKLLIIIALVQLILTSGVHLIGLELPILLNLILSQVSIILPFAIYCIITKQNPLKIIRFNKIKWHTVVLSIVVVLCSYPVIILLNVISMLFVDNAMASVLPEVISLGLPIGISLMAIAPAIFEETIFRGMLYNTYSKHRPVAGIIFSALLFGLMHQNFNQMPYAFYLGLIMAFMLEASDTIIAPMIMHFTLNGISTLTGFLTFDPSLDMTGVADFRSIIGESIQMSMSQTGMRISEEEITALIPVIIGIVIVVFSVMALIALAIVGGLIYAVFRLNNRRPKDVLKINRNNTLMVDKKNSIIDLWIVIFMIYTIVMCFVSAFR